MKRIRRIALLLCASLLAGAQLTGCEKQPTEEPLPPQPTDVPRYWLQWSGCPEALRRPDGTLPSWDWESAVNASAAKMHILFQPTDENGDTIRGVPDTASFREKAEECTYELEKTHEAGIRVIAYSDDVQVSSDSIARQGVKPEEICAIRDGEPIIDTNWIKSGVYIACISSPVWRDWLKQNLKITAELGYDGLQYDYGPYAAAGWFCECKYCREGWEKRSTEKFGKALPLPTADKFDLTTEENREYIRFKIDVKNDFLKETSADAFAVNPDFEFLMNQNGFSCAYAYEALAGVWNAATTEVGRCDLGKQTTFYLNKLTEALGYSELNTIINDISQASEAWKYRVYMAESYSATGGASLTGTYYDDGKLMFDFAASHTELFAATKSQAKVAMLFSAESETFSQPNDQFSNLLHKSQSKSRQASDSMTEAGILHDFIVLEKDGAIDKIADYDVFVVPQYIYFEDETWQPMLKAIAESGKHVVVCANTERNAVVKYVTPVMEAAGNANLSLALNITDRKDLRAAFKGTTAEEELTFLNNETCTEATVRSYDKKTYYVHLIHMGQEDAEYSDCEQEFSYRLPKGKSVKEVKAYCPYADNTDVPVEFSEKDGTVTVKTGTFATYCIVALTLD